MNTLDRGRCYYRNTEDSVNSYCLKLSRQGNSSKRKPGHLISLQRHFTRLHTNA